MAENFNLIFGQNASQQYAWNDADYQNGWETIGNIPPTAAQFDALQRRADTKAQELNSRLTTVEQSIAGGGGQTREADTTYAVGDVVTYDGLPMDWVLVCIVGGTTGSADITLPSPRVEGARILDGTVTWALRKIATYGGIGYRQSSTSYYTGSLAFSTALPTGWYLECTTAGATSASDLVITFPTVGATVTDGAVVWTIRKLTTVDIPDASSIVAGIMKLYSSTGANTDGTMTQQSITDALNNLESLIGIGGGIATQSLAANGYVKFANGFMLEWGNVSATSGKRDTVTFPVSFTSACYNVLINEDVQTSGSSNSKTYSISKTSFMFINGSSGTATMRWLAYGV